MAKHPSVALHRKLLTQWRVTGMVIGSATGLFLVGFLVYPDRSALVAKGPMNTGHEELACQDCHLVVEGTVAQ